MTGQLDGTVSLGEVLRQRAPLPRVVGLRLLKRLGEQIRSLHEQGKTHRAIDAGRVLLDEEDQPRLSPAPAFRRFGGDCGDLEYCPPELAVERGIVVPADIEAAWGVLREAGVWCDPRRIDLYQLGTLAVRLFCQLSVREYLCSPKASGRLSRGLQRLVDGALGYCPAHRFDMIEQVLGQVSAGLQEAEADSPDAAGGSEVAESLPFQRLGQYQVTSRIGRGGMGDVYRGYDELLERTVAIKVLLPSLARDQSFVRRFATEAAAMAQLSHPNLVPVYSLGEQGDYRYFVMPYVAGESLAERLTRQGRLSVPETLPLLCQCLEGLAVAHAHGLIHRDIKPGNILLERDSGRAMLVDFGLVQRMNRSEPSTAGGVILGTADYIAPEQVLGGRVDRRADLYALGVLAYQMLSGQMPYPGDTPTSVLYQHAHEEPLPLSPIAPQLPLPLCRIVMRLMARQPDERYGSCEEVLADLEAFRARRFLAVATEARSDRADRSTAASPANRPLASPMAMFAALGAILLPAAGAMVLGWSLCRPASPTAQRVARLTPGPWVDLLERVRLKADIEQGSWRQEPGGLRAEGGQASRLLLPARAEGDYSLEVEFTVHTGVGGVMILFPVGCRSCQLALYGRDGLDGLERIDGHRAPSSITATPSRIEPSERHRVHIDVCLEGEEVDLQVVLDGRPHLRWHGPQASLSTCLPRQLSDEACPALGVRDVDASFHAVRFLKHDS